MNIETIQLSTITKLGRLQVWVLKPDRHGANPDDWILVIDELHQAPEEGAIDHFVELSQYEEGEP